MHILILGAAGMVSTPADLLRWDRALRIPNLLLSQADFQTSVTPASRYYSPRDNFVATVTFTDGSVFSLTYTAMGHKDFPKE